MHINKGETTGEIKAELREKPHRTEVFRVDQ